MEGRTHRPELEPELCGVCGVCRGACPALAAPDLAAVETDTLRASLIGETSLGAARPPCRLACPLGQDIPGYLERLARGDQAGALEVILRDNPLPSVLGRVCHHPCQAACLAGRAGDGPRIRDLKRFAALAPRPAASPPPNRTRVRAAIIGSGPAGLAAAWALARGGAGAVVFEAEKRAGGMLAWAIPEFRLPRRDLERDLAYVSSHGVEFKFGVRLAPDDLEALRREYDAVILACGAPRARGLDLPGADLDGVWLGLDFLRRAALGPEPALRDPVVIVGGGDTALDAARWALRRAERKPALVYRRDRAQMPAYDEEIQAARQEGLEMLFRLQPASLEAGPDGALAGVRLLKTQPGRTGPDGRAVYEPLTGREIEMAAGTVILALGQETEAPSWARSLGLDALAPEASGRLAPGLYAAGDMVTGPANVVQAMAAGLAAARAILEETPS